jgi:putative ABC transport system substrate-binding protein
MLPDIAPPNSNRFPDGTCGNVTGFSSRAAELEAKRLQLLKEVVPELSRVAVLFNPTNQYMPLALRSARKGAQKLHVSLAVYEVHDITTLDAAFVTLTNDRPDALMVPADTFLVSQRKRGRLRVDQPTITG